MLPHPGFISLYPGFSLWHFMEASVIRVTVDFLSGQVKDLCRSSFVIVLSSLQSSWPTSFFILTDFPLHYLGNLFCLVWFFLCRFFHAKLFCAVFVCVYVVCVWTNAFTKVTNQIMCEKLIIWAKVIQRQRHYKIHISAWLTSYKTAAF